ncbi:glutathione S-transferase family protein [Saccharophagus degradans]|uniref:glutathione S-transferase family protein n=1 Tax=Saccharophagus degradans TaxID=86304 RepID=UPI002477F682|nr:glutathione S-transferase family protein [Saccharophagus degradans]WGO99027.1 glutathione S-transferase family protein [Saccharophagus degradans]
MDTPSLTVYAYTFRSRAERVIWLLEELHLPYAVQRLDPFKGETRSKEFLAINPAGKVPVLMHNGKAFTESLAIMEYLAAEFDGQRFIPQTPQANYHYRHVLSYGSTELEAYLWLAEQSSRLNRRYQWPSGTHERALAMAEQNMGTVYTWLQQQPYVAGQAFTLADIYYYHLLSWFEQISGTLADVASSYLHKLEQRPSFPACVKNSDASK